MAKLMKRRRVIRVGVNMAWSSRKGAHAADIIYGLLYGPTVRPRAAFLDTYGGTLLWLLFTNVNDAIEVRQTCKKAELQHKQTRYIVAYGIYPKSEGRYSAYSCIVTVRQQKIKDLDGHISAGLVIEVSS